MKKIKADKPPLPLANKPLLPVTPLTPAQLKPPVGAASTAVAPVTPATTDGEGNVLEQLFTMSLRRSDTVKPAQDTGMQLVQAIAASVTQAQPVSRLDTTMLPHLGEMSAKIHLMLNALNYHNLFERGALYSLARWTLEKGLWQDLMSGNLAPVEKLALLQLATKEMDKVEARLGAYKENLETSGRGTTGDIQTTAERVDRSVTKEDNSELKELEGTSPVGREVTRRLLDKAAKALDKKVQEAIANSSKEDSK